MFLLKIRVLAVCWPWQNPTSLWHRRKLNSKVFIARYYCNIKSVYTNMAIHRTLSLLALRRHKLIYVLYKHSVRKFLIIKPTRCSSFSNLFWNETLHVSDSSSVHHQELFTIHTAMVYVIQVCWQLASRISMGLVFWIGLDGLVSFSLIFFLITEVFNFSCKFAKKKKYFFPFIRN